MEANVNMKNQARIDSFASIGGEHQLRNVESHINLLVDAGAVVDEGVLQHALWKGADIDNAQHIAALLGLNVPED